MLLCWISRTLWLVYHLCAQYSHCHLLNTIILHYFFLSWTHSSGFLNQIIPFTIQWNIFVSLNIFPFMIYNCHIVTCHFHVFILFLYVFHVCANNEHFTFLIFWRVLCLIKKLDSEFTLFWWSWCKEYCEMWSGVNFKMAFDIKAEDRY